MNLILLIALGGAFGAVLRYATNLAAIRIFGLEHVITGTVIANATGCLIAGILLAVFNPLHNDPTSLSLFFTVGILGSYTTFSSFSLEVWKLLESDLKKLGSYLFLQLVVALGLTGLGFQIMQFLLEA